LGYYENITVTDNVPLIHFNNTLVQFFQDFLAPFYLFTKANHASAFSYTDNIYAPQHLIITTFIETKLIQYTFKKVAFELELKDQKIHRFSIHNKHKTASYIRLS
jgi:hypothetical protein